METSLRLGRLGQVGTEEDELDKLNIYKTSEEALAQDVLPRSRPVAEAPIPKSGRVALPTSSAKTTEASPQPFLYKWPGTEQPTQQPKQQPTDGSFTYVWPGSKPAEPTPAAKPAEDTGDFLRGGAVALEQTPALAYGALGFAGATGEKLFGEGGASSALKKFGLGEYQTRMKEIGATAKESDDVTKAWAKAKQGDLGALVDWAQYGVGYLGGSVVETVITSALGSMAGAAVSGPAAPVGAVGGAVAGAVGKEATKTVAKNLIEGMVAKEAARLAEKAGVDTATDVMLKEATKNVAKNIGSTTALAGSGIIKSTGGIYGEAEEQAGKEGRELDGGDLARIFGSGVIAGLSEAAVDRLGLDVAAGKINIPGAGRPGRALIGGAAGVGIEGGQELFQTAIERFGAGKTLTGEDAMNEYINAFALGGLGGGTVGAVVGAFRDGKTSPDRVRQILDQAKADMTSDDGRQELFDAMFDDERIGPILQANNIESGDDPRFQDVIVKALATQRMLVELEAPTPEVRAETRKQREADILAAFDETASTAVGGSTGAIEPVIQRASVTPNLETRTLEGEAQPVILPETTGGQAGTVALSPEDLVARQEGFEPLVGITTDKGPVGNRFPSIQAAETFLLGPVDKETSKRSGGYAQTTLAGQGLEARIRQGKRSKAEGGGTFFFVESRRKPAAVTPAAPVATPAVTPVATTGGLDLVTIPYEFRSQAGQGQPVVTNKGQNNVIDYSGRKIVIVNINGTQVPFYLSTGKGGKKDVTAGKWYPFFGIGADGWINKTSGSEINSYYGSNALRNTAATLDQTIGDIRDDNTIPKVGATGSHMEAINRGLNPSENETAETVAKVRSNIDSVLKSVEAKTPATTATTAKKGRAKKGAAGTPAAVVPAIEAEAKVQPTQGEADAAQTRQVTEGGQPKREDVGGGLPEVREDRVVTAQEQTGGGEAGGGNQPIEGGAKPQEVTPTKPAVDPALQARVKERINKAYEESGLDLEDVVKLNKMVDDGDLAGAVSQMKKTAEDNLGAGAGAKFSMGREQQTTTTGRDFSYAKLKTVDDLNSEVRAYLKRQGSTATFSAKRVPLGDIIGKVPGISAVQRVASLFGKKPIYFAVEEGSVNDFDGAVLSGSDTIFININSSRPHIRIFGHELVHSLRASNNEVYRRLVNSLTPLLDQAGMFDYRLVMSKEGVKDPALILEEAIGDIVGDRFGESAFWQMLADDNPTMFQQVARIVMDFIDNVIAKLRGDQSLGSKNLVTDLNAVRRAVADVLGNIQPAAQEAAAQPEAQSGEVMFSRKKPGELFYSAMYDNIERNAQNVMPSEQWKTWLTSNGKKMGIKAEEVTWSGIMDWLSIHPNQNRIKKEDVLSYIAMNNVNVNTVNLSEVDSKPTPDDYRSFAEYLVYTGLIAEPEGGLNNFVDDEYEPFVVENYGRNNFMRTWSKQSRQNATKHGDGDYVLPDGKDYEETVLLVPTIAPYKKDDAVHFGDVANGQHVGWLRHNVRKDSSGEDVLFLEEIQSQRAQDALKFGFEGQRDADVDKFNGLVEKIAAAESPEEKAKLQKQADKLSTKLHELNKYNVPPAPFIKDTQAWVSLLIKRAVGIAVNKGIKQIAWTTGKQQSDRFDISKDVSSVRYDGKNLTMVPVISPTQPQVKKVSPAEIADWIGVDLADKLLSSEKVDGKYQELSGAGLKASSEGMVKFYEEIVPLVSDKFLKEFGGKSTTLNVGIGRGQFANQPGFVIPENLLTQTAEEGLPMFSRKRYEEQFSDVSPDTRDRALKKGFYSPPTIKERLDHLRPNFALRIVQGTFDKFRSVRDISQKAYMMLRMSTGSQDGAVSSLLHYGQVFNDDGALNVKKGTQGLLEILDPVGGEVDRFLLWIAANRAAALSKDERERFFSPEDIKSLRGLNMGTMKNGKSRLAIYAETLKNMNELNRSVLDVARDTGLIDAEGYKRFAADIWYIPFYRQMEDDGSLSAAQTSSGAVGQYLSKKLKGSERPLNDLMENVLMNWTHILSASMKNQAAVETLSSATQMGDIVTKLERQEKGAVKVMEKGVETFYRIDDEFLLTSLSAVAQMPSYGWGMDIMRGFKTTLTRFISLSPTFKINNLIRDSIQSIGLSELSRSPIGNVMQGWRAYKTDRAEALAGGGLFAMGNAFDGDQSASVKRLLKTGVNKADILDTPEKVASFFGKIQDKYDEISDASENANRLALYQQLRAKGASHLEASYAARDLQDFSLQGSYSAIRYAAQVLPYFNARLQGMYKLGRDGLDPTMQVLTGKASDTERQKAAKFATVTGAVVAAAMILYLSQKDDEDWKKREDWDRDAFFWFKLPGTQTAVRIPKPFEMGAIATLFERMAEQMIDSQVEGKVFGKRLLAVFHDTFAVNPIPQAIRPLYDIARNKDGFTDRPIESMGMERISVENRASPGTSGAAVAISTVNSMFAEFASKATGGAISAQSSQLSAIQYDYMLKGYLGWVGTVIQTASNVMATPFKDGASSRYERIDDFLVVGNFVKTVPQSQSRYVTSFYENSKDIATASADVSHFLNAGQFDKARDIYQEKSDKLALAKLYTKGTNMMSSISNQIKMVEDDKTMSGAEKRLEIERLQQVRIQIAKSVEDMRVGSKKKFADGGVVKFDPESEDYDYDTAVSAGLGPDGKDENAGHWGSVTKASAEDKKKYGLPDGSYVVLKGRKHETWDKAEEAERERGSEIVKMGDRYYSVPKK